MQETSFENWKKEVDKLCKQQTGMITDDLMDVDYIGLYKTGNTPQEAVDFVIEYNLEN